MKFIEQSKVYLLLLFTVPVRKALPLCSVGQFPCRNSPKCIPTSWLCDGARDCPDGSDETHSQCHVHRSNTTCSGDQPECRHGGVQRCIPQNWLCDGHRDCDFGEDEMNCYGNDNNIICNQSQYRCDNLCLNSEQLCNGVQDCRDGSDEEAERCRQFGRNRGKIQTSVAKPQEMGSKIIGNVTKPSMGAAKVVTTVAAPKLSSTSTAVPIVTTTSGTTSTALTSGTTSTTVTLETTSAALTFGTKSTAVTSGPKSTAVTSERTTLKAKHGVENITVLLYHSQSVSNPTVQVPSASTLTVQSTSAAPFVNFLNYRVLEPVSSVAALKEISGEVFWKIPKLPENSTVSVMAKTFRSQTTTTTEKSDIALGQRILNYLHKREVKATMEKASSIDKEEKQQQNSPTLRSVQRNETELEPVNAIKGVPIKPMNL